MNIVKILLVIVTGLILVLSVLAGQKVETVDVVRVVHNTGPWAWGNSPPVALEPVAVMKMARRDEVILFKQGLMLGQK
ncbi:MAG: hypothetical protein JW747_10705 [Candidatus Aminicenantes bacterium]|nr:hypothetical protein [Candidatus Aminicenantes bacterium]